MTTIFPRAECKTLDGRRVAWFDPRPVFADMWDDEAVRGTLLREYVLRILRETAKKADPPGVLDEETLTFETHREVWHEEPPNAD